MQTCEQLPRGGKVGEILKFPPLPFSKVREGWIVREQSERGESVQFSFQNRREGLSKRLSISVSHRG